MADAAIRRSHGDHVLRPVRPAGGAAVDVWRILRWAVAILGRSQLVGAGRVDGLAADLWRAEPEASGSLRRHCRAEQGHLRVAVADPWPGLPEQGRARRRPGSAGDRLYPAVPAGRAKAA